MKPIKVAIVIPTHFNPNSSLHALLNAYRFLQKKGYVKATIFTDELNKVSAKDFKVEKIRSVDYQTILEKGFFVMGLPRFYYVNIIPKLGGYDAIDTSNPEFYWFAYQSYLAAKKHNTRLMYRTSQTVEGFFLFSLTKHFLKFLVKPAYRYASKLLFTNPEAAERCVRLGFSRDKNKFIVTGHATDTKLFKPLKVKKEKNKILLLSVGGLYKLKGHHLIIKAVHQLHKQGHKNVHLDIAGAGYYEEELYALVRELQLQDYVTFLGSVSYQHLPKIYNEADIFVLANDQEITPAVNEALACETPVVVMECGGRSFVLPSEKYGLVSKKNDVKDMAKKIKTLIDNPKKRTQIGKAGRKRIDTQFSQEAYAFKLLKGLGGKP